jgi:hypothetical protein
VPVVVPRCIDALPVDGTQLVERLAPLVLGVTPVPFAPFVVLRPEKRASGFVAVLFPVDAPTPVVVLLALPPVAEFPEAVAPVASVVLDAPVLPAPMLPVLPTAPDVPAAPVPVVAAPVVVPPNVAVVPVPLSVRPVAPVAFVMPVAGDDMVELPLICIGGQGCMLLALLEVDPEVVCCAPADAASAAPITSVAPTARHRTSRCDPASDMDIVPSVGLPRRPRGQCTGGARHPASCRIVIAPRTTALVEGRFTGAQCACPRPRGASCCRPPMLERPSFRMHV